MSCIHRSRPSAGLTRPHTRRDGANGGQRVGCDSGSGVLVQDWPEDVWPEEHYLRIDAETRLHGCECLDDVDEHP